MSVDYNNIAKSFSQSRKNMKWEEIEYFLEQLNSDNYNILDVWCGNGRFYGALLTSPLAPLLTGEGNVEYLWIDLSQWLLDEAQGIYPWVAFQQWNMLELQSLYSPSSYKERGLGGEVDLIFFIASFHHLENIEDRLSVLQQAYDILQPGWTIYMTNWALDSEINTEKYSRSIVPDSQNKFWSHDYSIKFWEYPRYYHWFSVTELEYLFTQAWFEIIENREFDTHKNFISIIKKPLH